MEISEVHIHVCTVSLHICMEVYLLHVNELYEMSIAGVFSVWHK